jgi:glycosyltransferase involved in cell wall biosynthesis
MAQPLISVVVPAYNVAPYIRECIESLAGVATADFELLVIDDGSTDGTGELLDELRATRPWLQVLHIDNVGVTAARSLGLSRSRGEYIWFVDADDVVHPAAAERIRSAVLVHRPDILQFDFERRFPDGSLRRSQRQCSLPPGRILAARQVALPALFDDELFYLWQRVFHRSLFPDDGLPHPELRCFVDIVHTPLLYTRAESFLFMDERLLTYRQREGSLAHSISAHSVLSKWQAAVLCRRILTEAGDYERCSQTFAGFIGRVFLSTSRDCVKRVRDAEPVALLDGVRREFAQMVGAAGWRFVWQSMSGLKPGQVLNFLQYYLLPAKSLTALKRRPVSATASPAPIPRA